MRKDEKIFLFWKHKNIGISHMFRPLQYAKSCHYGNGQEKQLLSAVARGGIYLIDFGFNHENIFFVIFNNM